ncbi:MAG: AMP-binding protein [Myxococcales bacterium]|nr:AMP-binding protein [Myxococcales bacterium]MCB9626054.1 AMP-binding protein [Sandaracinaceae bacterium]
MSESQLLLDRVYHWEKTTPNQLYMTQPFGGDRIEEYSWKRTVDEARRMASYLKSLDLPAGSRIGILSKNCAHFIMSDIAIWMAGHVSVALYPTLAAETVRYCLEHADAKLLFVGKLDGWNEMKEGVPEGMPCVSYPLSPPNDFPTWETLIKAHEPLAESPSRTLEEMAIIVYTSGSTGQPKGVVHSFGTIGVTADNFVRLFNVTGSDRLISYLPLAHVFERAAIECLSVFSGAQVFFADSLDTFVQDIQRARPTMFQSVPRLWLKFQLGVFSKMPPKKLDLFLKIPILNNIVRKKVLTGLGLQDTRLAISGSAPIPPELIGWYRSLGLELLEGYGMSENFCYSHMARPGRVRPGYVGEPDPGCEVRISEAGEILVKSPANMLGYYMDEERTKESFTEDGFLKTGDRGEEDELKRLKITGRVKELFKTSKGKYVAPAPIENLINTDNHVEVSCVSGSGQPAAYASIMLAPDVKAKLGDPAQKAAIAKELEALLDSVNSRIENFEEMQFFVVVKDDWQIENGFLTPTMKIKRNVIEETYEPKLEGWYKSKQRVIFEQ